MSWGVFLPPFFTGEGRKRYIREAAVHEVPLLAAIRQVLDFPAVQADLAQERPVCPSFIRDISDGALWSSHPKSHLNPIRLGIYNDAVEYVEAIGAFRSVKKVIHWYITILNLSPAVRNDANHMILGASCFEKTQKKYGVDVVVSGVKFHLPWCMKPIEEARGHIADHHFLSATGGRDGITHHKGLWVKDTSIGSFARESYDAVHAFPELAMAHPSTHLGPEPRPVVFQIQTGITPALCLCNLIVCTNMT